LCKVAVGQRSRRKRGAQHVEGPERACPTVQCRAAAHNRAHAAKGSLSSELAHELFALLGVSLLHSDSLDSCPLLVRVRLRNRRNGESVSVSAHAKNAQAQQMRLSDAWPQQLSKPRQRARERNDVSHIRGCLARLAQCSGHMQHNGVLRARAGRWLWEDITHLIANERTDRHADNVQLRLCKRKPRGWVGAEQTKWW
jgi:hypothetical protein